MRGHRFDPADQQGEAPLALLEGVARGIVPIIVDVPVVVEVPTHPEEEMAGGGTLISGLKPPPPASVASSGMAASLKAAPMPGASDSGMPRGAGCAGAVGLQTPNVVDVPNAGVVGVPMGGIDSVPNWVRAGVPNVDGAGGAKGDVTSGTNGTVVDVVPIMPGRTPAISLAGQPAMAPMAPPCGWPRLPWLS
jgi:hypothetical protein